MDGLESQSVELGQGSAEKRDLRGLAFHVEIAGEARLGARAD